MGKEKLLNRRLAFQICFLLMTCVFLFNNVVQPLCDNLKVECTELMKDLDEEKKEKEKEGQDSDEYVTYLIFDQKTIPISRITKPSRAYFMDDHFGDVYTPPPEFFDVVNV